VTKPVVAHRGHEELQSHGRYVSRIVTSFLPDVHASNRICEQLCNVDTVSMLVSRDAELVGALVLIEP
jgi:hypothetical protein